MIEYMSQFAHLATGSAITLIALFGAVGLGGALYITAYEEDVSAILREANEADM